MLVSLSVYIRMVMVVHCTYHGKEVILVVLSCKLLV